MEPETILRSDQPGFWEALGEVGIGAKPLFSLDSEYTGNLRIKFTDDRQVVVPMKFDSWDGSERKVKMFELASIPDELRERDVSQALVKYDGERHRTVHEEITSKGQKFIFLIE